MWTGKIKLEVDLKKKNQWMSTRSFILKHLVVQPTREQAVLGLVMCNEADLIREFKVTEPLGGSDHNMIEFTLQFEREELESDVMVFQLSKGNYIDMREELARVDWKGTLAGKQ
eukprot:g41852.t1